MNYAEDLAFIHDAGFGAVATQAARELLKHIHPPGLVVDLGCGSGMFAEMVVAEGFQVIGVDQSPAMLDIARRRVPTARFECASVMDFAIPPCNAVTAIGEVFNYLFDERTSLEVIIRRIASATHLFLFDMATDRRQQQPTRHHFVDTPEWTVLVRAVLNAERTELTRHITTFRRQGELYRKHHETHRLRLWTADAILDVVRDSGFEPAVLPSPLEGTIFVLARR